MLFKSCIRFSFLLSLLFIFFSSTSSKATNAPAGMRRIPGGTFQMGQPNPDLGYPGLTQDEQPVHSVTVSAFYMDTTDVTQGDYQALMRVNPSRFTGNPQRPVENVSWCDAVLYCNARSKRDCKDTVYTFTSISGKRGAGSKGLGNIGIDYTKNGYRLPTEAEWEYACRAGSTTDYYWGQSYPPGTTADTAEISSHAVWYVNSPNRTQPVATKPPNGLGLYDMAGNVWQWCNDWYGSYNSSSQTNPTGPASGSLRVMRGGSWNYSSALNLCAAFRNVILPFYRYNLGGFRVVCSAR